jgi:adenylate kinase family enzyme
MKRLGFDVILLGDPASGKDTQAGLLMKKYPLSPIETGKEWRKMVKKNDFRGKWLKRTFGLGHPAPVAIVKWFLSNKVKAAKNDKDFIFIGNPRLKPEAQFLAKLLKQKNRDFFAFYVKLTEPEIFKRSLKRVRMEKEDRNQYIQNRINWHKNQVSKTTKYFRTLNKLKFINGNQSVKKVAEDINKTINDYNRHKRN